MDFFTETTEKVTTPEHYLFTEKYRPVCIEDYIGNVAFKVELNRILETGELPNLMLHGSCPGTGKTSAAKLIVKNIKCDYLYINASDTNGIDYIRDKVKAFASTVGFTNLKVVILDESDFLTAPAQGALRNIIETFSLDTRFIFTCNHIEKIIPALISRCQVYEIIPPSKKEIAIHLKHILDTEQIKCTVEDLAYIVNTYYPDIRKILNFSQQNAIDGEIRLTKSNTVITDLNANVITLIKKYNTPSTFNEIRQLVANNGVRHYEGLYQCLYDKVNEYAPGKEMLVILIIAEYLHQSSLVILREITFMACIAKILNELKT
jgi:DNA polymerase III delta prime subunit